MAFQSNLYDVRFVELPCSTPGRTMSRTGRSPFLEVTLIWCSGFHETVRLEWLASGQSRDVLRAQGSSVPLVVKIQTLSTVNWQPNSDEEVLAPQLESLVPAVYGRFEKPIGRIRCDALFVQAVSLTVEAFFDKITCAHLIETSKDDLLFVLIETLKQMCVYAGSSHAFRLGDWHARNLGVEQKRVYLIDWEHTKYSPEMTPYRRISPAMKTFLKWIPEFQKKPATVQEDVGFMRPAWMRLLEKIQQHLRFWWQHFQGGDLPSPSDLIVLSSELQNVARDLPAIELPLIACAPPSGMDHPGIISPEIVQGPSIYSSMKECLRKLLHADKRNTVEFVKQLALE